jgi:hypothetical protein
MAETPTGKTRRPGMFTKSVNFSGTLAGIPKPLPPNELWQVWYRPNHGKRPPLPPPGRSLYSVISTPDFFHPSSPHMSLSRPKSLSAVRELWTVPRVAGWKWPN